MVFLMVFLVAFCTRIFQCFDCLNFKDFGRFHGAWEDDNDHSSSSCTF